jgi:hypothetical protein
MYIGLDFLIDDDLNLYLSEVNTGVPAGAYEYNLVYLEKFGKPSGVFEKIENLSRKNFSCSFRDYIRGLPYLNDLRRLKIWMDDMGPAPSVTSKELRLEDKWIQYNLLSSKYNMAPTIIYDPRKISSFRNRYSEKGCLVIKKRIGRGGKGFQILKNNQKPGNLPLPEKFYIIQPYINSSLAGYRLSIRATAFCGSFVCMFASLSKRLTSNHGYRFYVTTGSRLKISRKDFRIKKVVEKAWEAEIFFGDKLPEYLYNNVFIEEISDTIVIIPQNIINKIKEISSSISFLYQKLNVDNLPECVLEEDFKKSMHNLNF